MFYPFIRVLSVSVSVPSVSVFHPNPSNYANTWKRNRKLTLHPLQKKCITRNIGHLSNPVHAFTNPDYNFVPFADSDIKWFAKSLNTLYYFIQVLTLNKWKFNLNSSWVWTPLLNSGRMIKHILRHDTNPSTDEKQQWHEKIELRLIGCECVSGVLEYGRILTPGHNF